MPGRLIVVIDDDQDTCDSYAEWLEYQGETVVCAASAGEAEMRLGGRAPAVCLLDLQLGETTGLEVYRDLRQRLPAFRHTAPIVLTGMHPANAETIVRSAAMEPVTILTKPVDPAKLKDAIDRATAGRHCV
jgi:two-component system response regulator PilR (NtrC family)